MPTKRTSAQHSDAVRNISVPIELLDAHNRNYRSHPDQQIERLAASLQRFSQVRSIVVKARPDGRYMILAGHGITEAARREGVTEMRCDVVPDDWDETQCAAYLIADNESSRMADDDLVALAAMLEEQRAASYHLESLGFSDDDLAALLEQLADEQLDEEGAGRTTELDAPAGGTVEGHYSVLVECADEAEQQRAYELLTEKGYTCRVLTL